MDRGIKTRKRILVWIPTSQSLEFVLGKGFKRGLPLWLAGHGSHTAGSALRLQVTWGHIIRAALFLKLSSESPGLGVGGRESCFESLVGCGLHQEVMRGPRNLCPARDKGFLVDHG